MAKARGFRHTAIAILRLAQIDDPDTLVINADKAMYKAKHNGKNRFHLAIQQIQLQN